MINTLLNRNKKATNVNELNINDSVVVNDKQIADAFNEYFVQIGPKLAAEVSDLTSQPTNGLDSSCPNSYFAPRFVFSQISQINVATRLRRHKISKATGMDSIPAKILKMSADIIAPSFTVIFNLSLNSGIYIDTWKKTRVTPIFKSENRKKCENYRPISILPIITKIFEKEVFDQLYGHLSQNLLLSKYQSGFRPKHSTMSALIQMCDQWLENMDNGIC